VYLLRRRVRGKTVYPLSSVEIEKGKRQPKEWSERGGNRHLSWESELLVKRKVSRGNAGAWAFAHKYRESFQPYLIEKAPGKKEKAA